MHQQVLAGTKLDGSTQALERKLIPRRDTPETSDEAIGVLTAIRHPGSSASEVLPGTPEPSEEPLTSADIAGSQQVDPTDIRASHLVNLNVMDVAKYVAT